MDSSKEMALSLLKKFGGLDTESPWEPRPALLGVAGSAGFGLFSGSIIEVNEDGFVFSINHPIASIGSIRISLKDEARYRYGDVRDVHAFLAPVYDKYPHTRAAVDAIEPMIEGGLVIEWATDLMVIAEGNKEELMARFIPAPPTIQ